MYEGQPRFSFGEKRSFTRDTITKAAQSNVRAAENVMLEDISEVLSVPKQAQRDFVKPIIAEMTDEYLANGEISRETIDKLFETAYEEGRIVDDTYYRENEHILDYLKRVGVAISEKDSHDIADWKLFRRKLKGIVKLDKNGINVSKAYDELREMNPNLFPESVVHPADQLQQMYAVGNGIRVAKTKLDEYYGDEAEEFKRWAKNDFVDAVDKLTNKLSLIIRAQNDRLDNQQGVADVRLTTQQALAKYVEMRNARKSYEKVRGRANLTEEDKRIVARLLRGELLESEIENLTPNATSVINTYRAGVQYEMLAKELAAHKATIRREDREAAAAALMNSANWKDRSSFAMNRETPERVFEMVMGKEAAAMIKEYIWPVHKQEAKRKDFTDRYRQRVAKLDLSREIEDGNMTSESHMVQLLGEAENNIRYLEANPWAEGRDGKTLGEWRTVVAALWANNTKMDAKKINAALVEFRRIYDELFENMNAVRVENGYEPIPYRTGYFPHFQPNANDGILESFGKVMGLNTDVESLPTTINGLTHSFRPGITFFNNALERVGFNTVYDAVEGFDKYIEGASNMIYHTRNLQKLRALENQIRYQTTTDGVREKVDRLMEDTALTSEQRSELIEQEYTNASFRLSNFVAWLHEYTNMLAGKKSTFDRTMEQLMGRGFYEGVNAIMRRVAGNMVAINPGSWLTNLIPLTQASGVINSRLIVDSMGKVAQYRRNGETSLSEEEAFALSRSVFLRNRKQSDPLVSVWEQSRDQSETKRKVRKAAGKLEDKLSSPMEWIDYGVAQSIVLARFKQNVERGLSREAALEEADQMTARIMADRSRGALPNIFSMRNPALRLFTQFQVEVNNQFSYMFKDVPDEYKDRSKAALAMALMAMFLQGWLYNQVYEWLVGRRPAFDPLDMTNEFVGDLVGYEIPSIADATKAIREGENPLETEKEGFFKAAGNLLADAREEVPFVGSLWGGGRLPIGSALPKFGDVGKALFNPGGEWSNERRMYELGTELSKPLAYVAMPFGGGQLKKTLQGLNAVRRGGSYSVSTEGEDILQYPVFTDNALETGVNIAKAAVFGKSSLPTAVDWVDSNFDSFSTKETAMYQAMVDVGEKQHVAYEFIRDMAELPKADQKRKFLLEADLSGDAKAVVYNSLATDKEKAALEELADKSNMQSVVRTMINMRAEDKQLGKFKVLADEEFDEAEYLTLMSAFMSDDTFTTVSRAAELGLSVESYVKVRSTLDAYDANGNGSYSNGEIEDAIDALTGGALGLNALPGGDVHTMYLTAEERAILWQVLTGSKSSSGNPYSKSAAQKYLNQR
jgi:hypothetical protein